MNNDETIEKVDELFSDLSEFGRIEAMEKLSRIRSSGPDNINDRPQNYYATIPAPDKAPHYGRGYVNISLRVIPWPYDDGDAQFRTVFTLTCIDDGGWDAHGPVESLSKAMDRCNEALEVLRKYEENGEWFEFEELKEEFQTCGLHLKNHH